METPVPIWSKEIHIFLSHRREWWYITNRAFLVDTSAASRREPTVSKRDKPTRWAFFVSRRQASGVRGQASGIS